MRKFAVPSMGLLVCLASAASADDERPPTRRELLQTFVDELVPITPGEGEFPRSFLMGSAEGPDSERPVHRVVFKYDFAVARYEVPQNLYESVMGENPSRWPGSRNSAERMTWEEANEFCRRLTGLLRADGLIDDGEVIRLPSEAEWEYCCRAGTTTAYSFGDDARAAGDVGNAATLLDAYAWHTGNAAGNDPPVGALQPNPWGLYDMHGYLWEFCADEWHPDYAGAPQDGGVRGGGGQPERIVLRGGSWKDAYPDLRCAARRPFDVTARDDAVGFRCVKATRPGASAN